MLVATYSKNSMAVLRVDAHFTVVESALKGYVRWRSTREDSDEEVKWYHGCSSKDNPIFSRTNGSIIV